MHLNEIIVKISNKVYCTSVQRRACCSKNKKNSCKKRGMKASQGIAQITKVTSLLSYAQSKLAIAHFPVK